MKTEIKEYIRNVIGKLNDKAVIADYNDKVCFMKYYTGFTIEESEIINIVSSFNFECELLFHRFEGWKLQEVFSPFTVFIREMYYKYYSENMTAEEFVREVDCYKALHSVYISYLKNGHFIRNEDIIRREVEYERDRIVQDMVKFVKYIAKEHNVVLVLDRIQEASESTIILLERLIKETAEGKIAIIGAFNETVEVTAYMKGAWNNLLSYIRIKDLAVDYEDAYEDIEQRDAFIPREYEVDDYIDKINDMFMTIQFGQAKYYLEIICSAIETSNLQVSYIQKAILFSLYAKVLLFNGEEKIAYVWCKKMYDIDQIRKNKELLFDYNYTAAQVYHASNQLEFAMKNIKQAELLAEELGDKEKVVQVKMLNILIILDKYPDVLICGQEVNIPKELIETARENNKKMHLTYSYVFGADLNKEPEIVDKNKVGFENLPDFMEGIRLSTELGNEQLIIRSWQRAAVQAGAMGKFDEVLYYYDRCLDIMEGFDKKHEKAQINNGIGYTCLLCEKYNLACDYFKKALNIGIMIGIPKYILDAVYNLAITGIIMGDYTATIKCIDITLKMMSGMGLERLNVCNKTKLYGLAVFAHIKNGHIYNAKLYLDMMETALDHILSSQVKDYSLWEDDMYIYYAVKAMINMQEKNYENAKKYFETLNDFWENIQSKQNYIFPRVAEEEAYLYEAIGDNETREKILKYKIDFCKENGLLKGANRLEKLLEHMKLPPVEKMEFLSDSVINDIQKTSERIEMKLNLEKKDKMLNFFQSWVDSLNTECVSISELINSSMLILKNTFDADSVLYISVKNSGPVISYYDGDVELKKYQIKHICEYFETHQRRIIVSRFLKSYGHNEELISALNIPDIAAMIAIPFIENECVKNIFMVFKFKRSNYMENLYLFNEEEGDVLRTAFSELLKAIERETVKEQIERNAVIDLLTGIYNRQGMKKSLNRLLDLAEEKEGKIPFTVLYMDLDNFKYCNDNFGHDVGDVVLKMFAKMLRDVVDDQDIVVRYGGDEFVLLLPERTVDEGAEVAERIFANIKLTKGFERAIAKAVKAEVDIPEQHRITCSIGIATGKASTYSGVYGILKKADEALYYVKKTTKHSYKVWDQSIRDSE